MLNFVLVATGKVYINQYMLFEALAMKSFRLRSMCTARYRIHNKMLNQVVWPKQSSH